MEIAQLDLQTAVELLDARAAKVATKGGKVTAKGGKVVAKGGKVAAKGGKVAARGGKVTTKGGKVAAAKGSKVVVEKKVKGSKVAKQSGGGIVARGKDAGMAAPPVAAEKEPPMKVLRRLWLLQSASLIYSRVYLGCLALRMR